MPATSSDPRRMGNEKPLLASQRCQVFDVGRIVDVHREQLKPLSRPPRMDAVEHFQIFLAGLADCVTQKLSSTGFPRSAASVRTAPVKSGREKSGAATGASSQVSNVVGRVRFLAAELRHAVPAMSLAL